MIGSFGLGLCFALLAAWRVALVGLALVWGRPFRIVLASAIERLLLLALPTSWRRWELLGLSAGSHAALPL